MSKLIHRVATAAGTLLLAASLAAPAQAQTANSSAQLIQGLEAVTAHVPVVDVQALLGWARSSASAGGALTATRPEIVNKLYSLAQITVQIQFALDSAIIRPESYEAIGAVADAMHDPILWNYHFVVVGNTDATGTREHNLKLSQQRADAIVEALVNLYRVEPARLEAVGLGQEALQNPQKPDDPINRRVQIFNIGLMSPMPAKAP